MHNSESDKTVYNISNRPYPTVEEYEDELKPFIDAGCEVRFLGLGAAMYLRCVVATVPLIYLSR